MPELRNTQDGSAREKSHPALHSSSLDGLPRFVRPMMEFILLVSVYMGSVIVILLAGVAVVMMMVNVFSGGSASEAGPAVAWLLP